jgi:hypothetical protein
MKSQPAERMIIERKIPFPFFPLEYKTFAIRCLLALVYITSSCKRKRPRWPFVCLCMSEMIKNSEP